MEIIDILPQTAIFLIYSDGIVEFELSNDSLDYHKEYFIELANAASRLNTLADFKNIPITREFNRHDGADTYPIDTALAQNGVAIFHNLYSDDGLAFNVTLPSELTPEQRHLINKISEKYDLSKSEYHSLSKNSLDTIEYSDFCDMIHNQEKS